jgi:hypothetical protein
MALDGDLQGEYSVRQLREKEERHLVVDSHARKRCERVAASGQEGEQMQ